MGSPFAPRLARQPLGERAPPQPAVAAAAAAVRRNPFSRASSLDSATAKPFRLPAFANCTDRATTLATTDAAPSSDNEFDVEPHDAGDVSSSTSGSSGSTSMDASPASSQPLPKPQPASPERPAPSFIRRLLSDVNDENHSLEPAPQSLLKRVVEPPASAALATVPAAAPGPAPASAPAAAPASQPPSGRVDWSISSEVVFTAASPFTWLRAGNGVEGSRALVGFYQHGHPSLGETTIDTDGAGAAVQQALMYVTCGGAVGGAARDDAVLSALQKRRRVDNGNEDTLTQRLADWRQGLSSVYYMLRHGSCPYFYLRAATYVVLFYAARGSAAGCKAVVTRSTPGLRAMLTEKGVPFSLPLAVAAEALSAHKMASAATEVERFVQDGVAGAGEEDAEEDEDRENKVDKRTLEALRQRRLESTLINNTPSLLLMDTAAGVHGLFNVLYTMAWPQLPELLAPTPFLNGTLRSAQITRNRPIKVLRPGTAVFEERYELAIRGPVLPSALRSLTQALAARDVEAVFTRRVETSDAVPAAAPIDAKL